MGNKEYTQYLCAGLGGHWLGIEINDILEIINPHDQKVGFDIRDRDRLNYHDKQIPAIHLSDHLKSEQTAYHTNNRIIVCDLNEQVFGLVVDSAEEIIRIEEQQIKPLSSDETNFKTDILSAIIEQEDRTVHILSVEKLFHLIPSR